MTPDDLARFPIWEYAQDEEGEDGQDECTVRPVESSAMELEESSYLVRTRFTLADGTSRPGLLTVGGPPDDGIVTIEGDEESNARRQPLVLASRGQVGFWFGAMRPSDDEIREIYRIFGDKIASEVFPIVYATDIGLPDGPVQGRVTGFLYLEERNGALDFITRSVT